MTKDEKDEIVRAFQETIDAKVKEFYIDREVHYNQHQFIESFMKWTDRTQSVVLKTVVTVAVIGVIGLLILGFVFWGRDKF